MNVEASVTCVKHHVGSFRDLALAPAALREVMGEVERGAARAQRLRPPTRSVSGDVDSKKAWAPSLGEPT